MGERRLIVVPIAGIGATRSPGALATLLGSCVGMIVQDIDRGVAVLAHVVRPSGQGLGMGPAYFADQAAERARQQALELGADPHRLLVRVVGGGRMLEAQGHEPMLDIGARNVAAVQAASERWRMTYGGRVKGPHDGGCYVVVDASNGKVLLHGLHGQEAGDAAWRRVRCLLGALP